MSPLMVFDGDRCVLTMGAPGGAWIGIALMQVVINVLSPLKRPFPAVLRIVEVDEFELLVMIENVNKLFELSHIHLSGMTWHVQKP